MGNTDLISPKVVFWGGGIKVSKGGEPKESSLLQILLFWEMLVAVASVVVCRSKDATFITRYATLLTSYLLLLTTQYYIFFPRTDHHHHHFTFPVPTYLFSFLHCDAAIHYTHTKTYFYKMKLRKSDMPLYLHSDFPMKRERKNFTPHQN